MKKAMMIAACALVSLGATAQEKQETLNPVVVTGTGTFHKAQDAPVTVKVITAKEIQDAQCTTLLEALTKLSSNVTSMTNGMGTTVSLNGVTDDYMVVLENGKRVFGEDPLLRVSMKNVKRIEIYSGAASTLYGSDALAGVINVITDDKTDHISGELATKLLSKGRETYDFNFDAKKGGFTSSTSLKHEESNGWRLNDSIAFTSGDETVLRENTRPQSVGYVLENFSQRFGYEINDKWSVYVRGNVNYNETERPQDAYYYKTATATKTTNGYSYDLRHESYSYGGGVAFTPNKNIHLYLDAYSDNYATGYDYFVKAADGGDSLTWRKRMHYVNESLRGIFKIGSWNKLNAGLEFEQENLMSASNNLNYVKTQTYNIFAQDEMKIASCLDAVLGLRYTYNPSFGSNFSPTAGLFYHYKGFGARANYSRGYKTPSLTEMYYTNTTSGSGTTLTQENADLKPETNHYFTANLEYSNKWMSVSGTAFLNRIRDMIGYNVYTTDEVAAFNAANNTEWVTIQTRDNVDEAKLRGFSFNTKFLLPKGITIGAGYTYTDSQQKTFDYAADGTVTVTKEDVDKSVKSVFSMLATYDKTWGIYHLNIALDGHAQSRRWSTSYGYAKAYTLWNLSTKHTFRVKSVELEPSIGIDNIFNTRDTQTWCSNWYVLTPGRSAMFAFAVRFRD